ncbi:ribbon-helix-helix protein, CopG family [Nocardiopsis sp. RSe5-2]|uniref:Ribbon-helix-helix protein, CopG family n=1 Tax=Nocardiopsis endophytica TaxID=3018445 RepID=A0ABT4U325_9ACTN|nr:ribbon-helix-helix protein, CopG family [Nocardiopsis endophytica]MDA2811361.1 ribbon-helix-helix protein, CopG family [Nocardiopsis endophytica]
MALRKITVMVDEEDLRILREAAAREGRPVSEYFREAVHLAALRARRWSGEWDIPEPASDASGGRNRFCPRSGGLCQNPCCGQHRRR